MERVAVGLVVVSNLDSFLGFEQTGQDKLWDTGDVPIYGGLGESNGAGLGPIPLDRIIIIRILWIFETGSQRGGERVAECWNIFFHL